MAEFSKRFAGLLKPGFRKWFLGPEKCEICGDKDCGYEGWLIKFPTADSEGMYQYALCDECEGEFDLHLRWWLSNWRV